MSSDKTRWPGVLIDSGQMKPSQYDVPYATEDPFGPGREDVNWRWVRLWEQENPNPNMAGERSPDFDYWYAEHKKQQDRAWVAWAFPQFKVWDWSEEDVATARRICARHVCSVCGRADDPGCVYGC